MAEQPQKTTDFGFRTVARDEKQAMVADVFHSVAAKYDVMNDLMSFGIHRIWKRFTIDCSSVRRGQRVLDLAGGTGDLAAKFSGMVGEQGLVVLADINDSMLKVGRDKLRDRGIVGNIYKGRVSRVLPGMQAAFVDIGLEKAAFLHASDIMPHTECVAGDEKKNFIVRDISELVRQ
ncbi:MAG: class I SAM-dependent methyltransferase, partial [Serratia symbiotica]|nr:class I SAM-dependent methyltransferase [Serratia symbiotica]